MTDTGGAQVFRLHAADNGDLPQLFIANRYV